MSADYSYLSASDGTGDASIMHVMSNRSVGATGITVDSTVGVSANFIASQGTLLSTGFIDPTTICNFKGHTSGSTLIIDSFEPGSSDTGSVSGQVIVIKPNTAWANDIVTLAQVSHNNDGTLKQSAVNTALGITSTPPADWTVLPVTPTVTASNGQKEHTLTYSAVDYTGTLQKGSKLRIPRSVTPPTQAMSFTAASSQYASKTSPAGITFTSDFTTEAWVYLNSYTSGAIIGRDSAGATGSGWEMNIDATGCINGYYRSAAGATSVVAYQSVPLKKWTHVAISFSVAGRNLVVYIDGVPTSGNGVSTGAVTVVQATDPLTVGKRNSAAAYFDGFLSEVRVWSTLRTATQLRDNMGISLVGTETNLVALFQGSGNFNDKTANANNLTASGGAIATQASNPYSATEYAIVTNAVYSGGNTIATVFSGQGVIPNATLSATSYSSTRAPFGFPVDRNVWAVIFVDSYNHGAAGLTNGVYYNPDNMTVTIPTGKWVINESVVQYGQKAAGGSHTVKFYLGTAPTTNQISDSALSFYYNSSASLDGMQHGSKQFYYTSSAVLPLYVQLWSNSGASAVSNAIRGDFAPTLVIAECAYL